MDSPAQPHDVLRFGSLELDVAAAELREAGESRRLTAQPFRVLVLLTDHAGELVTRQEIRRCLGAIANMWRPIAASIFLHESDPHRTARSRVGFRIHQDSAAPRLPLCRPHTRVRETLKMMALPESRHVTPEIARRSFRFFL
jgi:hypothetical protein